MLSYVHGASAKPLIGATIGEYFDHACEEHRDREALVVRHQNARSQVAPRSGPSRVRPVAVG
jgi:hypothetical protein